MLPSIAEWDDIPGFEVDSSRYPIAVIRYPTAPVEVSAIDRYREVLEELARYGRFVVIADLRNAHPQTAKVRLAFFKMLSEFDYGPASELSGEAIVVNTALLRGVVTAYRWFVRQPYPSRVFSDLDSALAWAQEYISSSPANLQSR